MLARLEDSVLVVVDMQPAFLDPIWERDRVLARTKFLVECAQALDVPILATEQVPARMGGTEESLRALLGETEPISKAAFSCWADDKFVKAANKLQRTQFVLVGIETHICVCQTAHDLMDEDFDVLVCEDATSARSELMHRNGLKRCADEGAAVSHTESVVYEWMRTSEHPDFREVLKIVKGG
ncbi:MAG: isochorismatase family protein [Armatimonadetes bacterium]|nr:isochorismatase family protein [Armatimonadota bacterium]